MFAKSLFSISIHALLAESDDFQYEIGKTYEISIHALLAESDKSANARLLPRSIFLSTLSLRRATPSPHRTGARPRYFYPRSPCGERQADIVHVFPLSLFLSTLSLRRATIRAGLGRDCPQDFYPRSPCGERPQSALWCRQQGLFLSTLSLRRATMRSPIGVCARKISIHALLAESDVTGSYAGSSSGDFYPRSPCGERPGVSISQRAFIRFLSTLSLRRATHEFIQHTPSMAISIHALLAESDRLTPSS